MGKGEGVEGKRRRGQTLKRKEGVKESRGGEEREC